ncbi:MAG TPA: glycosyltransferase family 9 protein [Steroidobacteraceae bacterium]|jgi:ADP-heptose:LPS heptosyltransferase
MNAAAKRSLIIFRIGSIGDTVVALPCFHAIARAFADHRRVLLTNAVASAKESSVESVLQGTGLIDGTVYFPVGEGKIRSAAGLVQRLRAQRADLLIYLTPRTSALQVYRDLLFFRAAGIHRFVGVPLHRTSRACRVDPRDGIVEPEVEHLARTLAPHLAVELTADNWDLRLSSAETATAAEKLRAIPGNLPLVALSPGAKIAAKDWGEHNWAALIDRAQEHLPPMALVFVGAPSEHSLVQRLLERWSGPRINLCGQLTPRESAAVLGRCSLLVCHDSGPMHLAASQGTPCIALFGNYNRPRQWFPYGEQHRVLYEPRGVRAIGVDEVVDAMAMRFPATRETQERSLRPRVVPLRAAGRP